MRALLLFALSVGSIAQARPLGISDLVRLSQERYVERLYVSSDLRHDGRAVLYIVCDRLEAEGNQDTGYLWLSLDPLKSRPKAVLPLTANCHNLQVSWGNEDSIFHLIHRQNSVRTYRNDSQGPELIRKIEISVPHDYAISNDKKQLAFDDWGQKARILNLVTGVISDCELPASNRYRVRSFFSNGDILVTEDAEDYRSISLHRCPNARGKSTFLARFQHSLAGFPFGAVRISQDDRVYLDATYIENQRRVFEVYPVVREITRFETFGYFMGTEGNNLVFLNRDPHSYRMDLVILDPHSSQIVSQKRLSYSADESGTLNRYHQGRMIYFGSSLEREFPELIYENFEGNQSVRLTHLSDPIVGDLEFPSAKPFQFRASDGAQVVGYIFGASHSKAKPMIVGVRGGPGVWQPNHASNLAHSVTFYELLAENGFTVLLLNPRGWKNTVAWTGDRLHSEMPRRSVADMDEAIEELERHGVRISKVGVTGMSAGGIFTTWAMHLSKKVDAAMPVAAAYDTYNSMFQKIDGKQASSTPDVRSHSYWKSGQLFTRVAPASLPSSLSQVDQDYLTRTWQEQGIPTVSMEDFNRANPIAQLAQLKIPLFIVHGGKDGDDTSSLWARNYFAKLKELQKQGVLPSADPQRFQMALYEDQGHGLTSPEAIRDFAERAIEFFRRYLGAN